MARHVFYSFHYAQDYQRAQLIRNVAALEGQHEPNLKDWETLKRSGDMGVRRWVEKEMYGKSCVVVLIGSQTAERPGVLYEIQRGWDLGKAVVGIYIHGLKNAKGETSAQGVSPFEKLAGPLAKVPVHLPEGEDSKAVYGLIKENIASWVDGAVACRNQLPGHR